MDSPHLQSLSQPQRVRTNSTLSIQSIDHTGGIRKRSSLERYRSVSTIQVDRLHQLALEQSTQVESVPAASGIQWITPQHSPQTQALFPEPSIEPFPNWTVPTPPRSDSGLPTLAIDTAEDPATTGITTSQEFQFEQPTSSAEMSSLGFLLPSQYGSTLYESEPSSYAMDQNYIPPMKVSQPSSTGGSSAYAQTISSSPALYQSRTVPDNSASSRRHSEFPNSTPDSSYGQSYRRVSNPYDSSTSNPYSSAAGPTIPSISGITQSPLPSPHLSSSSSSGAGSMSQYQTSLSRSPAMSYDTAMHQQPYSTSPGTGQLYAHSDSLSYPPPFVGSSMNQVLAKPLGSDFSIRVLNQRPKPQCWEHGCNGRQFSTFSNLLRHQREKSGTASKSYCPKCGAEFTRTTARNGHLAHDKCSKQRRQSEDDK